MRGRNWFESRLLRRKRILTGKRRVANGASLERCALCAHTSNGRESRRHLSAGASIRCGFALFSKLAGPVYWAQFMMKKLSDRPTLSDSAFLVGIEFISTMPYLFGLGFYTDDWSYQGTLAHYSGDDIGTMIREMIRSDPHFIIRPVQLAYLVLSFKVFGQNATLYHVFNSTVLGLATALLYLALRELQAERWVAFVIALIFALLPHYSTDRFFYTQGAVLSMAFAMLGLYALLRSGRALEQHSGNWVALAVSALLLSILSHEVFLGLIVASLGVIAWCRYRDVRASAPHALAKLGGVAIVTAVLFTVGLLKTRIQSQIIYHHHFFTHLLAYTWHAIVQAVLFNFWTYGLHMPGVLAALYRQSALTLPAFGSAGVIAGFVAAYLWKGMKMSAIPTRRTCLRLIVLGFVLFGLGYALFFPSIRVNFSTAGLDNRVEIASTLGASCTLVAMLGLACSLLKSNLARTRTFSLAVGLICGINSLAVSGIAFFWVDAASQQSAILKSAVSHVRSLPHGSVLLLDGFCQYLGPGIVFETDWDATGAIQREFHDPSISSDVVSQDMRFYGSYVETRYFGELERRYAYGNDLFVYNVRRKILTKLPSQESAIAYLRAMNPTGDSGCPTDHEGEGRKVF